MSKPAGIGVEPLDGQTSFVGRKAELARVARAFEGAKLVTVLGPPGMGKTRLARQFAAMESAAQVGFCDLTEASSADGICAAVARTLGLPLTSGEEGRGAAASLGAAIRGRGALLLVLDNFEHLVAHAVGTIGVWLEAAPAARFLVTSRERLGVAGEALVDLGPLALPEGDASGSEAVDLFVERARLVRPDYALTAADAPIVAELVRELDGLPLAIELCAARMRVLSPAQILANMARRFELLSAEARASVAGRARRGTTLWDAIESSWSVLSEADRRVLAAASAFRGGFDLDALGEVIGDGDPISLLDALQRLVDRSLLRVREPEIGTDSPRFSMYLAIREFASKMLAESGVEAEVIGRHAARYRRLGATWSERLEGPAVRDARRWLELESENLVAVHQRGLARGEPGVALDAALALAPLIVMRGPFALGLDLLDRALAAAGPNLDRPLLARGLTAQGQLLQLLGRRAEAIAALERARALASELGDRALSARALTELGKALFASADWRGATRLEEESLALYREIGDPLHEGQVLCCLADAYVAGDEGERAERLYEEALALLREADDPPGVGAALGRMGMMALDRGDHEGARERLTEALRIHDEYGNRTAHCWTLGYLAILEQDAGRFEAARAHYDAALAAARRLGHLRYEAMTLVDLGLFLQEQGRLAEARAALTEAIPTLDLVARRNAALARACLGAMLADAGEVERAESELAEADAATDGLEQSLRIVALCRGHLDLARARAAAASGESIQASQHRVAARERLDACTERDLAQLDVRFVRRNLARAISAEPAHSRGLGHDDFAADVLVIEPSGAWFRPPNGKRVDLTHRQALRHLLAELCEQRRTHPGEPVTAEVLIRRAWPADAARTAVTANRLRVALFSLRKLGLGGTLVGGSGGYFLDPAVPMQSPKVT